MRVLEVGGIPTSLGEIINYKYHLDLIKHKYDRINLSFNTELWKSGLYTNTSDWNQREILWKKYITDIGKLFFSEHPYVINPTSKVFRGDINGLLSLIKISPKKAELHKYLCRGVALNTQDPYVVITTKIREMPPRNLYEMYSILRNHNVVILGERKVEMRKEYVDGRISVFGIYDEIIRSIPREKIIDLTVPALGETVSSLSQIQQDCFIMHNAKYVVTLGIGGNLCMAIASANKVIGYRTDSNHMADAMYNEETENIIVTKNWDKFIQTLRQNS